ncbi:MAG: hypothetical protein P8N07_05470 [Flavobacteriales bacterium]|jgi:hypothetical protein|nr:hypothetical protein [Flavobacteriales bacterium]|tara:strand:+ start:188 stop:670 length:483 start_codon:yes stop_codon:yes gene_type:complete
MKPVTVSVLKQELKTHSQHELIELCLKLAKFKKENKELLTYLLYDAEDEDGYIREIKEEVDLGFEEINKANLYYIKKGCRKNLKQIKKYIRYSKKKETEAELLLYFCSKIKELQPKQRSSQQMINMYDRQLAMATKAMSTLHEDLQYDFKLEIEQLEENS